MNRIVIIIDKTIMEEYKSVYFKLNPRCRVFPKYFKNPIPPSWNTFIAKTRMEQASMKAKYKQFGIWLCKQYKISGLNLKKVLLTYNFYFNTKHRHDIDNYTLSQKFLGDSMTAAKVIIDDDSKHLSLIFNQFQYDKENPRIELILEY